MADTQPDVSIPVTNWVNAHTITGLSSTLPLQIFNKSSYPVLFQITSSQPADDNTDGVLISSVEYSYAAVNIPSDQTGVWLRATKSPTTVNISED